MWGRSKPVEQPPTESEPLKWRVVVGMYGNRAFYGRWHENEADMHELARHIIAQEDEFIHFNNNYLRKSQISSIRVERRLPRIPTYRPR